MSKLRTPRIAVDAIIESSGRVLLIERKNQPFKGCFALPGGFVEYGESLESAVRREVLEETGLRLEDVKLHNVYSEPGRDQRGHVISVCYSASGSGTLKAGSDAEKAEFHPIGEVLKMDLAFDHNRIIKDYLEKK
ncbi:MAG: NUDIX domain-containing protein [Candidatus Hydrothermarchaeales archaeon]